MSKIRFCSHTTPYFEGRGKGTVFNWWYWWKLRTVPVSIIWIPLTVPLYHKEKENQNNKKHSKAAMLLVYFLLYAKKTTPSMNRTEQFRYLYMWKKDLRHLSNLRGFFGIIVTTGRNDAYECENCWYKPLITREFNFHFDPIDKKCSLFYSKIGRKSVFLTA